MDDEADPEQLRENMKAWKANTAALDKLAGLLGKRGVSGGTGSGNKTQNNDKDVNTYKQNAADFNQTTRELAGHFKTLGGSTEDLLNGFHGMLRGIIGGALIEEVITAGHSLVKSYQNLTNIGQNFGGSMFEMAQQAGAAGLPLSQFSKMLTDNSSAAAILSQQSRKTGTTLGSLQLSVRDNLREFGFYGMSVSQISDLTGGYAETLRQTGRISKASNVQTGQEIASFAKDISDFSSATGKSREEIAKITNDAMRDVGYASLKLSDAQSDAGKRALAFTASLPGSAGTFMSKMLSQTIAYGGAQFADDMGTVAESGGAEFLGIMDTMASKVEKGQFTDKDAVESFSQIQNFFSSNLDTLRTQAQAGNKSAREMLQFYNETKNLTAQQFAAKQKEQQEQGKVTAFFTKLEDDLSRLSGSFLEGMMDSLASLEQEGPGVESFFDKFKTTFKGFGQDVGIFIKSFANPDNINHIMDVLKGIMNGVKIFADIVGEIAAWAGKLISGIGSVIDFMNKFGGVGTLLLEGLGGLIVFLKAKSFMKDLLGIGKDKVTINAASVNINTRGFGGGGGTGGTTPHTPKQPHGTGGTHEPHARATPARGRLGKIKQWGGKALGMAEEGVGMLGGGSGGGCCDGMLGGLENLTDMVDTHGKTAAENAGKATAAAEETAEHLAKAAPVAEKEGGLAFRAGKKVASMGSSISESWVGKAVTGAVKSGTSLVEKTGISKIAGYLKPLGKWIPFAGAGLQALDAKNRFDEGDRVGAAISGIGAAGGVADLTGVGAVAGLPMQYGAAITNGVRDLADIFGKRDWLDHFTGLDKINTVLGGKNTNDPATPNDDKNNPYKDMNSKELADKQKEVTDNLEDLKAAVADNKELLAKIDQGNIINQNIAKLTEEQNQIVRMAAKKTSDEQKKTTQAINQAAQS
ncbi:unnamed protein product [Sphagnum tenellum]